MAKSSESGQIVIEMALLALMMVGIFLLAVSISESGNVAQKAHRFQRTGGHAR